MNTPRLKYHSFRFVLGCVALLALLSFSLSSKAAGLISVPAGGVTLTFDNVANPPPTNGFSTQNILGAGNSVNDPAAMNLAVPTNDIANITALLPQSASIPPTTINPSFARYNTAGTWLQMRPTGNAYNVLVGSFRNDSGQDRNSIILTYDQGFAQSGGTEQVPGLWVYYSLTGAPGTWQKLEALSGREGNFNMSTNVTLTSSWEVGANLYILWADDNADGFTDGDLTIDNLSLQFQTVPLSIATQPHDITFEQCRSSNLTVVVTGSGPITYQWFKGGGQIQGATSATLNFNNAIPSDSATYFVRATGPGQNNTVESTHVTVTVTPDTTPPTVVSAVAPLNGTNVIVTFSEPMDTNTAVFADPIEGSFYHIVVSGSGDIADDAVHATVDATHTVVTLSFPNVRTPNTLYDLLIDSDVTSVRDCSQNPLTGDNFNSSGQVVTPLSYEIVIAVMTNMTWQYTTAGDDLGLDWYKTDFNATEAGWSTGKAVLDGKQDGTFNPTPRTTVSGQEVQTQLPLRLPTGQYATSDIPVYYFRSSFTLPVALSHVKSLELRPFVDDFDIVYLNGNDTPVHIAPDYGTRDINFFGYPGGTAVGTADFTGPYGVSAANLVDGSNLIAVKLYQQAIGSSDITLGYELRAIVDAFPSNGPSLAISQDSGTGAVTISWAAGTGAALYESSTVDGSTGWSAVAGATDGSYSFTPSATGQKFYTLRQ